MKRGMRQVSDARIPYRADHYADWSEFVAAAAATPEPADYRSDASRNSTARFTGTDSWDSALTLARQGWPDGAERIRAIGSRIGAIVQARVIRREPQFTHRRGLLVKSRYAAGNPRPMLGTRDTEVTDDRKRGKVLSIVVNRSALADVPASLVETRGAAVAALVDALERGGRRCEVSIVMACDGHARRGHETWVQVKAASEPLSLETLAMAVAHPATHRRLDFALREALPASDRAGIVPGGYGSSRDVSATDQADADVYVPCIRAGDWQFRSEAGAVEWVTRILREQGVEMAA